MVHWRETLVAPETPIREVMRRIEESELRIALVTDEHRVLQGVVTDGDIRRGILTGATLEDPVARIMHTSPVVARQREDSEAVAALMRAHQLHHIPVVDAAGQVVGLEIIDALLSPEPRANAVVLMVGGLGTRLRPLTDDRPKPLIEIGSKPILQIIIENFIAQGFHRFYLAVNFKAELIEDHFGDGARWGVEIAYLREQERLGTAGSLHLLPEAPEEALLVMNGDLLTKLNFARLLDYHGVQGASATMCVRDHSMQVPYGVVEMREHRIATIQEKPAQRFFVNAGVYVLEPEALRHVPSGRRFDMTDLFEVLIAQGHEVTAYPIQEYWIDVGQPQDLKRAKKEYKQVFR